MKKGSFHFMLAVLVLALFALTAVAQSEKVPPPDLFPSKPAPLDSGFGSPETGGLGGELPPELQSVLGDLQPLIGKLSLLVGGLFGLYLILLFIRVYYDRKQIRLLKDIRYNLDQLNLSQGVNCSQQRPGFFKRLFSRKVTPEQALEPATEPSPPSKKKK